jgi:WhiB family transcriptional regulator, redox-sensing transcriptional regulator
VIIEALGWEHEPTPWARHAACAGSHPDLWFPDRGQNIGPAKAVCAVCPVRLECLDYALRWDIRFGVWGGLSEQERRRISPTRRSRRLPAAHGTTTRYARGCRCEGCRQANHDYQRHWRPGRRIEASP